MHFMYNIICIKGNSDEVQYILICDWMAKYTFLCVEWFSAGHANPPITLPIIVTVWVRVIKKDLFRCKILVGDDLEDKQSKFQSGKVQVCLLVK